MQGKQGERMLKGWLRRLAGKRWMTLLALLAAFGAGAAAAQGTKQWTVDRFEDLERGTPAGVAIRSDGRIEAGPESTPVYAASGSYVWSLAEDAQGLAYVGLGGNQADAAAVMHVSADGKGEKLLQDRALGVQAVRVGTNGSVYAATSPDGRVYRLGASAAATKVVFDPAQVAERPKYLWDLAVGGDGDLYVATGAPAAVYRVPASGGAAELLFRTADQHIRCLLLAPGGVLWAGSDGAGVVYRIETKARGAKPFAAYAAGRREITSLAIDAKGDVFAAAVGSKGAGTLPPLPVTGSVGITVTFVQPASTAAAGSNGVVADGSELDRIAANGTPERLLTLKDDVIYALAVRKGQVFAATGNKGRVYRIDPDVAGQFTEVARLEAGQVTAFAAEKDGLLAGTANGGKVVRLSDASSKTAAYTSEVFDAGQFSRWGRIETDGGSGRSVVSVRTGNVPNAIEGWSEWMPVKPGAEALSSLPVIPAGRYAQWRAEIYPGAALTSVTLNFLPRNVAPVVDEVVVATGARVTVNPAIAQPPTVQVVFPSAASAAQAISFVQQDAGGGPLVAQKDRSAVTVRWSAHDENGDDLTFSVWYRGMGEANWRVLKSAITDRFLSFDSALLPDGRYELRVVANDGPEHTDAETLTGERASAAFTIDTTPPVPGTLAARMEAGRVHWTLEAHDAVSPIAHAEYAIDAGPWQFVEPIGGLSDGLTERYDTTVELPVPQGDAARQATKPGEHVLAVRVYDRAENMTSVKTVVR